MSKFLSNLFSPIHSSYSYSQSKEEVKQRLEALFSNSGKFLSEADLSGQLLSPDSFVLSVPSGAFTNGIQYRSTLYGHLIGSDAHTTSVEIKVKASSAYKIVCWIAMVFGGILLIQAVYNSSLESLVWAVALLTLGPLITNWLAGVANETVIDRYRRFIDRELKRTHAPNTQL